MFTYRELLDKTLVVLQLTCSEAFERKEQLGPILDDSPARGLLDDNIVEYIDGLLNDDLIVEEYRPLFEQLRDDIESAIVRWQSEGNYSPLSRNPYVNLLGLYAEDYINLDELSYISHSREFDNRVQPGHAEGLFDLITTLYAHLKGQLEDKGDPTILSGRPGTEIGRVGCDLLKEADSGRLGGLGLLWKAYFFLLEEKSFEEVEPLVRLALEGLTEPSTLGDRHDALVLLAGFYKDVDRVTAATYQLEAQEIEHHLGVAD